MRLNDIFYQNSDSVSYETIAVDWPEEYDKIIPAGSPVNENGEVTDGSDAYGVIAIDACRRRSNTGKIIANLKVATGGIVNMDAAQALSGIVYSDEVIAALSSKMTLVHSNGEPVNGSSESNVFIITLSYDGNDIATAESITSDKTTEEIIAAVNDNKIIIARWITRTSGTNTIHWCQALGYSNVLYTTGGVYIEFCGTDFIQHGGRTREFRTYIFFDSTDNPVWQFDRRFLQPRILKLWLDELEEGYTISETYDTIYYVYSQSDVLIVFEDETFIPTIVEDTGKLKITWHKLSSNNTSATISEYTALVDTDNSVTLTYTTVMLTSDN